MSDKNMNKINSQSSWLPNAGIDDYFLYIFPDVPEKCTEGIVGFVGNDANKELRIEIEIDGKWMVEHNFVSIAFVVNQDEYQKSSIVMTPRYFEMFRKTPCLVFELWHEIAHYHTMHHFDTKYSEKGSTNATRLEYHKRGEVMPEERVADLFGLYYSSKKFSIQALSEAMKRRRTYTWEPKETTEGAIEELRRRKKLLNNFDGDDKIRKALCELCNKSNFYEI